MDFNTWKGGILVLIALHNIPERRLHENPGMR